MKRILVVATLLASATLLQADDEHLSTLKVGSEIYTNVTLTSTNATHVYFMHSRGVGSAKLKELDPDLQKFFHYDDAAASAAELKRAQANAAYRQGLTSPTPAANGSAPGQQAAVAPSTSGGADGIPPHEIHAKSFLNQFAPELKVEKWLTPEPDTHGKFVLIDFWATWCGPCRRSIPDLNILYGIFKKRLVVIGLSGETEYEVKRMRTPPIAYAVAIDTSERMASLLEIKGIPHAILIDPKGIVRFEGHPVYLNQQNLAALLDKYSQPEQQTETANLPDKR